MMKFSNEELMEIQKKMIRMMKSYRNKVSGELKNQKFLSNKKKFGGAHTETIHLKNCVPKHLRGEKIVDFAINDLFNKEILINKQSTGENHCSLNTAKLKEIEEIETN